MVAVLAECRLQKSLCLFRKAQPIVSLGSKMLDVYSTESATHLQDVLDASVIRTAAAAQRVGKKWYFENLDIQGIKCNLTLIPKSSHSEELGLQRARLTTAFGIHFMDINNVSLRINALQMRNAFVTWRTLVSQIYRHLFFQVSSHDMCVASGVRRGPAHPTQTLNTFGLLRRASEPHCSSAASKSEPEAVCRRCMRFTRFWARSTSLAAPLCSAAASSQGSAASSRSL